VKARDGDPGGESTSDGNGAWPDSKRDYQVGEWWLGQRDGSAGYYAIRYDAAKKYNERVNVGTSDPEVAKERLTELHLRTRLVKDERPETASLAEILRRYWEEHASRLRSAKSNRHRINVWLDHWQDAMVGDLGVQRARRRSTHGCGRAVIRRQRRCASSTSARRR
jgi:hypothetical protein